MKKPGKKMISTYENQLKKFGPVPAALGCPKGRQDIRFEALTEYLIKGNSLLDYGCGFGDLFLFFTLQDAIFSAALSVSRVSITSKISYIFFTFFDCNAPI